MEVPTSEGGEIGPVVYEYEFRIDVSIGEKTLYCRTNACINAVIPPGEFASHIGYRSKCLIHCPVRQKPHSCAEIQVTGKFHVPRKNRKAPLLDQNGVNVRFNYGGPESGIERERHLRACSACQQKAGKRLHTSRRGHGCTIRRWVSTVRPSRTSSTEYTPVWSKVNEV